ncbi:unnamed protein product [Amoebophrya sp. A120]|nr:unnamed protein product [Amoebophrya sp. A120]|eukprot:GSA120T00021536001.1
MAAAQNEETDAGPRVFTTTVEFFPPFRGCNVTEVETSSQDDDISEDFLTGGPARPQEEESLCSEQDVTLVITTSAIPLNPSTKLIEVLLQSFAQNLKVDEGRGAEAGRSSNNYGSRSTSTGPAEEQEVVRRRGKWKPIPVHIFCDGYTRADVLDSKGRQPKKPSWKKCRITEEQAANYEQFVENLCDPGLYERVFSAGTNTTAMKKLFHPEIRVHRIGSAGNWGFAKVMQFAVEQVVRTKYVLVAQHDYMLIQAFPLSEVLQAMEDHPDRLGYVGFDSLTTTEWSYKVERQQKLVGAATSFSAAATTALGEERDQKYNYAAGPSSCAGLFADENPNAAENAKINSCLADVVEAHDRDKNLPPGRPHCAKSTAKTTSVSTKLVKKDELLVERIHGLEFQKMPIWYDKTHLCRVATYRQLFAKVKFPPPSFIEDVFFNERLSSYELGLPCHVLRQNMGPVVYHLSGRKLAEAEGGRGQAGGNTDRAKGVHGNGVGQHKEDQEKEARDADGAVQYWAARTRKIDASTYEIPGGLRLRETVGIAPDADEYQGSGASTISKADVQKSDLYRENEVAFSIGKNNATNGLSPSASASDSVEGADRKPRQIVPQDSQHPSAAPLPFYGAKFDMFQPRPLEQLNKKFTGTCFRCGRKGHSSKHCTTAENNGTAAEDEQTVGSSYAEPAATTLPLQLAVTSTA